MVSSAGILVTGSLPRKQTPDETPEDCIRRMEKERIFNYGINRRDILPNILYKKDSYHA